MSGSKALCAIAFRQRFICSSKVLRRALRGWAALTTVQNSRPKRLKSAAPSETVNYKVWTFWNSIGTEVLLRLVRVFGWAEPASKGNGGRRRSSKNAKPQAAKP